MLSAWEKMMTEQEWLTSNDPDPMLEFLQGKVSDASCSFSP